MNQAINLTGYSIALPDVAHGAGCYIFSEKGKRYLDFTSGVWALPLGHSHPLVNTVISEQSAKITHTSYGYSTTITEEAAHLLSEVAGMPEGKVLFLSSGSEAVETGLKTLRNLTQKKLLRISISYLAAYGIAGSTDNGIWHTFDYSQCKVCKIRDCNNCEFFHSIPFNEIGAFILEPGCSMGLVHFPTPELIKQIINKIKSSSGYVFVDEVTTGFGRTGKWFGYEHYDFQPDIIATGKGMGNGYPVSSVIFTPEIYEKLRFSNFHHAQSHQNDPLGAAVVKAVIGAFVIEKIIDKSSRNGKIIAEHLRLLKYEFSIIKDIRCHGMMFAIEFLQDENFSTPQLVHEIMMGKGIITELKLSANMIRFFPPLIVTGEEIEFFIGTLKFVLHFVEGIIHKSELYTETES